ncbi:hypothetical protein [Pseudodesulfovibrio tunisiensis]|uniref:hypothetical protein n=1 Tax=Pseudodesulfovibrio tunisiensis TaxID=463192 RepID=UPI001FB42425|nr:hypothetical protein [Pseudodesulfovibrio tunisiensis]
MDTYQIIALIIGCIALLFIICFRRAIKAKAPDRPGINIDFDTAKEREDKNRYFS